MGNFWVKYPLFREDMSLNIARVVLLAITSGAWAALCIFILSKMRWISAVSIYPDGILLVILCSAFAVLGGVLGSIRKNKR